MRLDMETAESLAGLVGQAMEYSAAFPLTLLAEDKDGYAITMTLEAPGEYGEVVSRVNPDHQFLLWPLVITLTDAVGKCVQIAAISDLDTRTIQLLRCATGRVN